MCSPPCFDGLWVCRTEVGYTQGLTDKPNYEQACSGRSGHVEAVRVAYDPKEVSYEDLLRVLWKRHDPTQLNRQVGAGSWGHRTLSEDVTGRVVGRSWQSGGA